LAAIEPGPDETLDRLLGGRVGLIQPRRGYRVAIDPVLLAAAVPAVPGLRVLDLGCGVGAVALCLAARVSGLDLVGLEIQPVMADMARRNAALNGLEGKFAVLVGDAKAPPTELARGCFDHVVANPPYLDARRADPSPDRAKAAATVEAPASLADWLDACLRFVRADGVVTVIHRADRAAEIEKLLAGRAGSVEILPLLPKTGMPAKRTILRIRPAGTGGRILRPGFVLHEADGRYTAAAEAVLRGGQGID
jgi:tRNA1(Val) A37 N6-methylase TrmN6